MLVQAVVQRAVVEVLADVELDCKRGLAAFAVCAGCRRGGCERGEQVVGERAQELARGGRCVRGCEGQERVAIVSCAHHGSEGRWLIYYELTEEPPRKRIRLLDRILIRLLLRRKPFQAPDQLELPRINSRIGVQTGRRKGEGRRESRKCGREDELDSPAGDEREG